MKARLNLWQDFLKARALVYQFDFNITKMRRRALQTSGLFYLASKPPTVSLPPPLHHNPPPLFFFFFFFYFFTLTPLLSFEVWSKGLRKHMQSFAPLKSEQLVGFMSDSLSCLSPFLSRSFERNIPQGVCTHWISLFWQSKVESNVCNKPVSSSSSSLALYFLRGFSLLPSWQGQLPAHLMSAWRSRIMVRRGTVVIPVNSIAEGWWRSYLFFLQYYNWSLRLPFFWTWFFLTTFDNPPQISEMSNKALESDSFLFCLAWI